MAITLSNRAVKRIEEIRQSENRSKNCRLRIGVVGGGCSGLSYKLEFDESEKNPEAKEQEIDVDDIKIVIDMRSFLYLAGTKLDYTDGLEGKGFHFINPNASRTCSCGESFAV